MSKVQVIKAQTRGLSDSEKAKDAQKVAAYCRVSTDSEEQLSSYQAQVSYYTALIEENPEWEYADIYADEGISGTNAEKRPEFQRMIKDAKEGKIDLILTKSISRFARNVVDTLRYTRDLKSYGVAVKFEKENINTLEASGELMMTIFSSLAQEESRSISENSRWGIVKGFKDGKVLVNTKRFLGYDKDEHGNLVINEKEAEVIRRIYREYLEGKSLDQVAKSLEKDNILTGAGATRWWDSTIAGILKNEKYCGNLLQQKTVTVDFLTRKRVKNAGHADQYFIEDNHEPIISKETWEAVQNELERRARLIGNIKGDRAKYSNKYPFSSRVICGNCKQIFRRRTWNSGNPSEKKVWQCKTYIKEGKDSCDMKAVGEKDLEKLFVEVFNEMMTDKKDFFRIMSENIKKVLESKSGIAEIEKLDEKIEECKDEIKGLVKLKTSKQIDEEVYREEYERISGELNEARKLRGELEKEELKKEEIQDRVKEIEDVINSRKEPLEKFDEEVFNALVDNIEVISPAHFIFELKNGLRIDKKVD